LEILDLINIETLVCNAHTHLHFKQSLRNLYIDKAVDVVGHPELSAHVLQRGVPNLRTWVRCDLIVVDAVF